MRQELKEQQIKYERQISELKLMYEKQIEQIKQQAEQMIHLIRQQLIDTQKEKQDLQIQCRNLNNELNLVSKKHKPAAHINQTNHAQPSSAIHNPSIPLTHDVTAVQAPIPSSSPMSQTPIPASVLASIAAPATLTLPSNIHVNGHASQQ